MISSTGLVYGRIMRRQRAGKTDRENLHNLVEWPPYPSGSGYVVTRCVPLRELLPVHELYHLCVLYSSDELPHNSPNSPRRPP